MGLGNYKFLGSHKSCKTCRAKNPLTETLPAGHRVPMLPLLCVSSLLLLNSKKNENSQRTAFEEFCPAYPECLPTWKQRFPGSGLVAQRPFAEIPITFPLFSLPSAVAQVCLWADCPHRARQLLEFRALHSYNNLSWSRNSFL